MGKSGNVGLGRCGRQTTYYFHPPRLVSGLEMAWKGRGNNVEDVVIDVELDAIFDRNAGLLSLPFVRCLGVTEHLSRPDVFRH